MNLSANRYAAALVVCGITVVGAPSLAQGDTQRQADIAVLTHKKQQVWPALYAERDAEGLRAFLAEGFVIFEASGDVRTGEDEIQWLKNTPPDNQPSDFFFTIQDIVFPSDDVAVVYGHGDSTRRDEHNNPCHHRYWSSNLLVRMDGKWKASFSHVSGATCTPVEPERD